MDRMSVTQIALSWFLTAKGAQGSELMEILNYLIRWSLISFHDV